MASGSSTGLVSFSGNITDDVTGVKSLWYGFVSDPSEVTGGLINPLEVKSGETYQSDGIGRMFVIEQTDLQLINKAGGVHYLLLAAEDFAGNISEVTVYQNHPVLYDISPPEGVLSVSGLVEQGLRTYWNREIIENTETGETRDLVAEVTAWDNESGLTAIEYGIGRANNPGDVQITNWHASLEDADDNSLYQHSSLYQTAARITNGVENTQTIYGPSFIYDESEVIYGIQNSTKLITSSGEFPMEPVSDEVTTGELTVEAGETIIIKSIVLYDILTPFTDFKLQVRNVNDPADTSFMNGLATGSEGWLNLRKYNRTITLDENMEVYGEEVEFLFTVPDVEDGAWEVLLESGNCLSGAIVSEENRARFILNTGETAGRLMISGNGPYQALEEGSQAEIVVHWEHSNQAVYGVQYRVREKESGAIYGWSETVTNNEIIIPLAAWIPGEEYSVEIIPVFNAGDDPDYSVTYISLPGVQFDDSEPVIENFDYPAASAKNNLWIAWNVSDDESGIKKTELRVLKAVTVDGVLIWKDLTGAWLPLPLADGEEGALQNLNLHNKYGLPFFLENKEKIVFELKATNHCNMESIFRSGMVLIDNSPPPVPVVLDQGEAIKPPQMPEFSWIMKKSDPESGIVGYKWALIRSASDLQNCE